MQVVDLVRVRVLAPSCKCIGRKSSFGLSLALESLSDFQPPLLRDFYWSECAVVSKVLHECTAFFVAA
jgi:hypothetical protein